LYKNGILASEGIFFKKFTIGHYKLYGIRAILGIKSAKISISTSIIHSMHHSHDDKW
jgi:hypothetical protein